MPDQTQKSKLELFFKNQKQVAFKKGDTILKSGTNPPGVYFIEQGFVRQYIFTQTGQELTLHFFKPKSFFPLFWAVNDLPNRYYYQAFTPLKTYLAPKDEVINLLKTDPELVFELSRRLLSGIDGLVTRIEFLASRNASERTLGILYFLGKHFGTNKDNKLTLNYPFTHEDIATLTGLTRETTSRELKKLAMEGKIVIKNRLISVM